MIELQWVRRATLLQLHAASLAEYGGRPGIRDRASLISALARPRNRYVYEPGVDLAALAASYSFGITRNYPFNDGNKRASLHAADLFILLNGYELDIEDEIGAIDAIFALAAGEIGEDEFAVWIRSRLKKLER
jgi:death on curing protein